MLDTTTFVGLDVHARSIKAVSLDVMTGEVRCATFGYDAGAVAEWVRSVDPKAKCVYESGVTGFDLQKRLTGLGVDCVVGAVSKMIKPSADRRRKNDRNDAEFLARMLSVGNVVEVWVPDDECEAARDLTRALEDARDDLSRSKQRLSKFLLRHGLVFDERTPTGRRKGNWTRAHWSWIESIRFAEGAIRELRLARAAAGGEGYLELEWAPGTCQVDFGNFRAAVGGRTLDLKLLVATLPHSNDRQCVALMSQRSECLCAGLLEIFRRWGRAPAAMVLDNATEAGRMVRGEVTESRLFSQFRAHYRFESRYCNPYSGNEKGSVENAVGFLRRNLLVPVPAFGALPELNAFLAEGCARINAAARCRDGRPHGEAYREDLAAMRALPGVEFDAVRWVTARADKRGYVEADGREYVAGPAWHGRSLLVGMRASTVEILADRGRRVAVLPRAFGEGPAVRNPLSLVPAIIARPRAFGESTIRRDMPPGLVEGIDRMDSAGRRRTLRSIGRASESSGFEAACEAALRVVEGGRVPDDATVDVLARRIAGGGGGAGGADLSVYDGFLKGAVADGS